MLLGLPTEVTFRHIRSCVNSHKTGPLHYRCLQQEIPPGNHREVFPENRLICFGEESKYDLKWWLHIFLWLSNTHVAIMPKAHTVEVIMDASGINSWRFNSSRYKFTQGTWEEDKMELAHNLKDMVSAIRSLDVLIRQGDIVSLGMDSTIAATYVNKKLGTKPRAQHKTTQQLWNIVFQKYDWLPAHLIPRKLNQQSDIPSKIKI